MGDEGKEAGPGCCKAKERGGSQSISPKVFGCVIVSSSYPLKHSGYIWISPQMPKASVGEQAVAEYEACAQLFSEAGTV